MTMLRTVLNLSLIHILKADREEALRYFAQAAAQGNTYAQYFIDHQEDLSLIHILHEHGSL